MVDEEKITEPHNQLYSDPLEVSQATMNETTPTTDSNFDANTAATPTPEAGVDMSSDVATPENAAATNGEAQTSSDEPQIAALKAQVEERTNQYLRIVADFDNFRKRSQKEKEDLEQQIKGNTITELLPVVDNFERARSQLKPQTEAEMSMHKSYQSVYKQLVDCLKRLGVAPMRPEGKEFDPSLHEAVMRQPSDEYPEGTVLEELVRGYFLGDRILRHAMVKVASAPEPVANSEEDSTTATEGS
ncbi:nucleotide exchange factor GrpE [Aliterella atlantica]|uniref:Protein GrpE n=1 Tax=Aliterella atlantica CENA595 TaxID=1618023 RepID=A0A0D8ZNG1_9CYAN|nr:nucleotide exchange factor GrpE [Aliterella atlantica]KJH70019.1 hypothetical protein UH38_20525 [Aliterella atlantica CENA595]